MTTKQTITCKKEILLKMLNLNKNELKLAMLILSYINPIQDRDIGEKTIVIPKQIIKDKLGFKNKKFYNEIAKISTTLNTSLIFTNKKDGGYFHSTWIGNGESDGYYGKNMEFQINSKTMKFFTDLTPPYVTIDLDDIINLNSRYSIGIFSLIQADKYKNKKYHRELIYPIEFLQNIFDTKYKYKDFKKSVLNLAIHDINTSLGSKLNYSEVKSANKVTDIIFTIEEIIPDKKEENILKEEYEVNLNPLLEKLKFYKISPRKSRELLEKFSHDHINTNLKYAVHMIEKGLKIKSQTGYIIKSIEENYSNRKESNTPTLNSEEIIKKEIKRQEKIEIEISKEDKRKWWESLEDEKQKTLLEEYKVGSQYMDKKEILLTRIYKDFEKEILEKKVNEK